MKMKILFWYWLIASTLGVYQTPGQVNLVPNGEFEEAVTCSGFSTISDWFVPQNNPVDLSNLCPYVDWWRFIRDPKMGINGSQCGFVETYYRGFADDNIYSGRLYLAAKLIQPLQAGQQYYFEMMVRSVDTFPNRKLVNTVFTNGQDVAFTKSLPLFDFDVPRNYLSLRPTAVSKINQDYEWHKISECFVADGTEHYLLIGNFRIDASTETSPTGKINPNFPNGLIANYAVDNVVLVPMEIPISDTSRCVHDTLLLNAFTPLPAQLKYRWHDGSILPYYTASQDGSYRIELIYSPSCMISKAFSIRSFGNTAASTLARRDTTICEGTQIVLSGGVHLDGQRLQWENGSKNYFRTIYTPGVYTVQIENRCGPLITQSFKVRIESCEKGLYIANIFTPNHDGLNDEIKPLIKPDFPPIDQFEWSVFNRWGDLMFVSRSVDTSWDGTFRQREASAGVYLYFLKIVTLDSQGARLTINKSGDFTLVR